MEEKYNWISAIERKSGKRILVRQLEAGSGIWFDKEEGDSHTASDLDFTQTPEIPQFMADFNEKMRKSDEENERTQKQLQDMIASMDAKAIADHQAEINQRAYWMKLRGEIFKSILENGGEFTEGGQIKWAVSKTEYVTNALYEQDKNLFEDK